MLTRTDEPLTKKVLIRQSLVETDLIRMKEAAGRPQDLEDLRVLHRLRAESK